MIGFFKRLPIYIKIYPNKIEITNLKTDQTVCHSSNTKFSSNRLVVAEFNIAENLISDILKEMGISKRNLKVIIQQIDNFEEELYKIEKRVLRDLAEQAGAAEVYLVNRKKEMNKDEVNNFLSNT